MTLPGGGHVSIGGVTYMLATDEEPHYVHRFESLFAPTTAIAGEISKEQIRPEKLLWAITDWSGGEGAVIYYPQDPTSYDVGSLVNVTTRGKLTTRPKRTVSSVARAGSNATTDSRPQGVSTYKYALIGWEDNIVYSRNGVGWASAQDTTPAMSGRSFADAISDGTNAAFLSGSGSGASIPVVTTPTSRVAWADTQSGSYPTPPVVGCVLDGVPYTLGKDASSVLKLYKKAATMTTSADWGATTIFSTGISVASLTWGEDYWTSCVAGETGLFFSFSTQTQGFIWEVRSDVGRPFWTGDLGFTIRKLIYKAGILFILGNQSTGGRNFAGIYAIPLATRSPIFISAPRMHRNTEFTDFSVGCAGPGNTILAGDADSGKIFIYDIEKDALSLFDDLANGGTGDGMSFTSGANLLASNDSSFETSVAGWTAGTSTTLAQSAGAAYVGTNSMLMTSSSGTGERTATTITGADAVQVLPSTAYTAHAGLKGYLSTGACRMKINWYDATGTLISTSTGSDITDSTTGWNQAYVTATSPSTAASASVTASKTVGTVNHGVYVDAVTLHAGTSTSANDRIAFLQMHGSRLFGATYQPVLGTGTSLQVFTYDDLMVDNRDSSQAISATLETAEWDFGLPMERKALVGLYVTYLITDSGTTSGLIANSRIKVEYSRDGAAYETAETITSATTPIGAKGRHFIQVSSGSSTKAFQRLKVRITLDNNSTAGVAPPVLYGVTAEAQPLAYAETWELVVRVEDETSNERPTTRANVGSFLRDSLEDLATNKNVVSYLDGYRYKQENVYTTHTVLVEDPIDTITSLGEGVMRLRLRSVLS